MTIKRRHTDRNAFQKLGALLLQAFFALLFLAFVLLVIIVASPEARADELNLNLKAEHTSNPTLRESGYGLNAAFVELEYRNNGLIIAGALGVHSEASDCPEVCFGGNELARVTIGYSFNLK